MDVDFPRPNRPGSTEEGAGKRLSKKEKKKEKKKKSRRNGVCAVFSSLLSLLSRVFCFAFLFPKQTPEEEENKNKMSKTLNKKFWKKKETV